MIDTVTTEFPPHTSHYRYGIPLATCLIQLVRALEIPLEQETTQEVQCLHWAHALNQPSHEV